VGRVKVRVRVRVRVRIVVRVKVRYKVRVRVFYGWDTLQRIVCLSSVADLTLTLSLTLP
jgi:hypothetical protein